MMCRASQLAGFAGHASWRLLSGVVRTPSRFRRKVYTGSKAAVLVVRLQGWLPSPSRPERFATRAFGRGIRLSRSRRDYGCEADPGGFAGNPPRSIPDSPGYRLRRACRAIRLRARGSPRLATRPTALKGREPPHPHPRARPPSETPPAILLEALHADFAGSPVVGLRPGRMMHSMKIRRP